MFKNIRQSMLTTVMVGVLLAVTTLSVFAGSWHVSSYYRWTVQNACTNQVEIVAIWEGDETYSPPFTETWEAYTWLDDGGPVIGPDPTWIEYAGDQVFDYLGTVDVLVLEQKTPLEYEHSPGDWRRTHVWGSATIEWGTPVDVGTGIYVTQTGPGHWSEGFVVAAQDCAP